MHHVVCSLSIIFTDSTEGLCTGGIEGSDPIEVALHFTQALMHGNIKVHHGVERTFSIFKHSIPVSNIQLKNMKQQNLKEILVHTNYKEIY